MNDRSAATGATSEPDGASTTRTLALTFEEARFSELRISDLLETALAPALLPRVEHEERALFGETQLHGEGRPGMRRRFADPFCARGCLAVAIAAPVGSTHITYLDEDTLIGRANGAGGTFIFERAS